MLIIVIIIVIVIILPAIIAICNMHKKPYRTSLCSMLVLFMLLLTAIQDKLQYIATISDVACYITLLLQKVSLSHNMLPPTLAIMHVCTSKVLAEDEVVESSLASQTAPLPFDVSRLYVR